MRHKVFLLRLFIGIAARWIWWNAPAIAPLLLLWFLLVSGAGLDLVRNLDMESNDYIRRLKLLMLLFGATITGVSVLITAATRDEIEHLALQAEAQSFASLVKRLLDAAPFAIGLLYLMLIAWRLRASELWLFAAIGVVLVSFRVASKPKDRMPNVLARQAAMVRRVSGGLGLVALCTLVVFSHIPAVPNWWGPLTSIVIAAGLWSCLMAGLAVAFPKALGGPSLLLLIPVALFITSSCSDYNRLNQLEVASSDAMPPSNNQGRLLSLTDHFDKWLLARRLPAGSTRIPVVLVAAEGGGIRAAYWTATSLQQLQVVSDGAFADSIYAVSGVSGGSLGLAAFLTLRDVSDYPEETKYLVLRSYFFGDFLSPLAWGLLVHDAAKTVFGPLAGSRTRGDLFEAELAKQWERETETKAMGEGFLARFGDRPDGPPRPAVFFNATNVESGRRVVLSNIAFDRRTFGEAIPFFGELHVQDLPLARAIHLGARFPFVSPPATLYLTDRRILKLWEERFRRAAPAGGVRWGRIVDGGYFENSGTATLRDVLEELLRHAKRPENSADQAEEPKEKPNPELRRRLSMVDFHVLVIRNDPDPPSSPALPSGAGRTQTGIALNEVTAPVEAIMATRVARGDSARRAIRALVNSGFSENELLQRCVAALLKHKDDLVRASSMYACESFASGYVEIGLGRTISDTWGPRYIMRECGRTKKVLLNDPPLSWVLSRASMNSMDCLHSEQKAASSWIAARAMIVSPGGQDESLYAALTNKIR
jgi:hypothetical protein